MKRKLVNVLILLVLLVSFGTPLNHVQAQASVFINEIHYDNAGADTGEAVEIAGPAGTDLTGWTIAFYNGSSSQLNVYGTIDLSGTIPNQQNDFGTLYFPRAGIQNGSPDGLALVDSSSTVIQFLSYEGSFTAVDGPASGMTSTDIGVSEPSDTPVGDSLQLTGSGTVYEDFTWAGPEPNTFGAVNTGQTLGVSANAPVLVDCGFSLSAAEGFDASQEVSASDADGTVVDLDITSGAPETGGITLSDVVPAGGVGGTATANLNVADSVPPGTYSIEITATNDDPTPQTGTCTLTVTVFEILPIGTVQGSVGDTDDGATFSSPYVGQTVAIRGVIYQKILARTSSGGSTYGFFIQNTAATADSDPNSSDGIFVFMSGFTDLIGGYVPQVGDEVILRARVSEYFNLTELSSASALKVLPGGIDLDAEVPAFEADPPADLADANRYWERHEGMRAQIPAGSIVLNGRDVFASTLDGEVWLARGDSTIAQRTDPYARRAFRDPHPLDDIPEQLFDNGNGYRIVLGSLGIKAAEDDNTALIAPSRTFDTLNNAPIGGVYFSFSKYQIQVEQQLDLAPGVDPSLNSPPETFDRGEEYSVVTFNVENLYDYRDDPFDGCDFTGNSGCPGVNPPFDYVPASDAAYQARLHEIAQQIVSDLHDPEIILAQEAEDQDICTVENEVLTCGTMDNADGKPDTLQELATVIYSIDGTVYDAAYDRDGADDRGIVSGYLFRTDRVELLPAMAADPVLGSDPTVVYRGAALPYNTDVQNPKALNAVLPADVDRSTGTDGDNVFTRAPQVGLFRIWRDGIGTSVFRDVYISDNHFSSTPDARVGQRTEQANYNAAIVAALQQADSNVNVMVGGDLNVYPRPDDPFTPGSPLFPSDQLAGLYDQGLSNLYDVLVTEVTASAYSYVFQGQAQTLDQIFVAPVLLDELVQVRAAHINSDWPSDYDGDGPRGTSDHDPQDGRFSALPTLGRLEALVRYYDASGAITGKNTTKILLDRFERAARFKARGQQDAYEDQLWAFISQTRDFTPQFIEQSASDALVHETELLLMQP